MKNRGSRQDLEGRLCTETAPAPPVTKPARPPRRPPPVDPHSEATLMIPPSLLARADEVIE
jgi:hypothetical protein